MSNLLVVNLLEALNSGATFRTINDKKMVSSHLKSGEIKMHDVQNETIMFNEPVSAPNLKKRILEAGNFLDDPINPIPISPRRLSAEMETPLNFPYIQRKMYQPMMKQLTYC